MCIRDSFECDFSEEEWQAIMDVKVPNVDSNVNDTVGKKDDSPSVKRTILVNDSITEHRDCLLYTSRCV